MPNKLCLVIDDSDIIRTVARKLLEQMGFAVVEASESSRGLEICQDKGPAVVLLDWRLPDVSGIEFIQALRRVSHHELPSIVYCATENDPADIARALEAGARAVLLKPFDRSSLATALAEAGVA